MEKIIPKGTYDLEKWASNYVEVRGNDQYLPGESGHFEVTKRRGNPREIREVGKGKGQEKEIWAARGFGINSEPKGSSPTITERSSTCPHVPKEQEKEKEEGKGKEAAQDLNTPSIAFTLQSGLALPRDIRSPQSLKLA
ncbi:hypothetical protein RHMOL_Rhmol04G0231000 [Rhododendron molle]|uniref:Uncharacterized protein n=1 Tax=Rhododendron molle TaxID=49168 RepID=A0ACC0P393_RHOML|nr:hypothetical protein RHMOL_Rhmol04G0231000 [Rhododendron molle]